MIKCLKCGDILPQDGTEKCDAAFYCDHCLDDLAVEHDGDLAELAKGGGV